MERDERQAGDGAKVARAALTETEGRTLLKHRFEGAGHRIVEDFAFREGGLDVTLDGFDPEARVGYEYLTREAQDPLSFTPEIVAALDARMRAGGLFILLVDEHGVDADRLALAADRFLEQVARRRGGSA